MWTALWIPFALLHLVCGQRDLFRNRFRATSSPNIVFIMVDDLGWNDIGYHGSEIRTPNLDALASNGVKLENYYTAPVCGPTRAQLLSGKYSIHLGIPGNIIACRQSGLTTKVPTIADKLKEQGYSTHMIGKWHAGFHTPAHLPTNRGFDTFRGHLLGHGDHYTHTRKYGGIDYLDYYDNTTPYNQSWGYYSTEIFTERAKEIIRLNTNKTDPMFMFLSYQAPHNPLQVPDAYLNGYESITVDSRRNYAAMVTAIDIGAGEVVQSLKDSGMYENTVIIFTSDNGGDVGSAGSNYPLRGNKGSLYEGGIRSVGFVSSPLITEPRRSITGLVHVTDWLPTLLHIAGASTHSLDIDGINQWNTISNGLPSPRKEILHNIYKRRRRREDTQEFNTRTRAALTVWPWKILTGTQPRNIIYPNPVTSLPLWHSLIQNRPKSNGEVQLFNIANDPSESNNLASMNDAVVQSLLEKLKEYESTIVPSTSQKKTVRCNPAFRGGVWGPYNASS